ncbi:MAG: hypothetical protein M1337_04525 [Actinobacteria bacterium]|nr:hypothetical protein [Actinomycetota bacterium]
MSAAAKKSPPSARVTLSGTTVKTAVFAGDTLIPVRILALLVVLLALALSVAILKLGNTQFPAEDGGITSLAGWQLHMGARAYSDLPASGLPPLYLLGVEWAYGLFGVHWGGIVAMTALFAGLAFIAQAALVHRLGFGSVATILLPSATICLTLLPASFWWSNQLTAVASTLFLGCVLVFVCRPTDVWACAALAGATVVLSWSKANSAGLLLVGTFVLLLLSPRVRTRGLAILAGSALVSVVLLLVSGVNPIALVQSYSVGGTRVLDLQNLKQYFLLNDADEARRTLALAVPAAIALVGALVITGRERRPLQPRPFLALCLLGIGTGLAAMGTNNDHNMVEMPIIMMGIAALVHRAGSSAPRRRIQTIITVLFVTSLVALSLNGLWYGADRHRIRSAGLGLFYEAGGLNRLGEPPFLRGLQTGPTMSRTVEQLSAIVDLNHWRNQPDAPVYFGPRLLWAYPAFGVRGAQGLPLWWQLYPEGRPRTEEAVRAFEEARFKMALFFHGDHTWMPESLLAFIGNGYARYTWGELEIWVAGDALSQVMLPDGAVRTR